MIIKNVRIYKEDKTFALGQLEIADGIFKKVKKGIPRINFQVYFYVFLTTAGYTRSFLLYYKNMNYKVYGQVDRRFKEVKVNENDAKK